MMSTGGTRGATARWVRAMVLPDRDPQDRVEAVYTIAFDIHDDVMERDTLRAARQRLDRFTEHIPYPLTYIDRDYRLRFVNLAYQQAVRMPAAELIGRRIGEVRGPARWAQHQPYFDRALAGETGEVCNLFKKWDREKIGLPGSRTTPEAILEELSDIVICVDLTLMQAGLNPDTEFLWNPFGRNPAAPLAELGIWITAHIGRACELHTENDYGEEFVGTSFRQRTATLNVVARHGAALPELDGEPAQVGVRRLCLAAGITRRGIAV